MELLSIMIPLLQFSLAVAVLAQSAMAVSVLEGGMLTLVMALCVCAVSSQSESSCPGHLDTAQTQSAITKVSMPPSRTDTAIADCARTATASENWSMGISMLRSSIVAQSKQNVAVQETGGAGSWGTAERTWCKKQ
ncbi:hypothetical protein CHLRE_09g398660v5 [Chlamydomonas reinhardtii]|uniref:Secreted protein n=1 Tax=Chlamydomonas reinhardtii TaxID=3055 RepID=A0A2K3DES4_CHLRE|nr:uncharacterized protein CHLRE_09g398660v5 [Chlamydomonas reinhardtii]PNW79041.1 hypothetical protein CHLRE_09g398660v5 [Chlamydomonas reinhardtii]